MKNNEFIIEEVKFVEVCVGIFKMLKTKSLIVRNTVNS